MKKLILILLLINFSNCVFADSLDLKLRRRNIELKSIRYSCMFIAGYKNGTNDKITFNYNSWKRLNPNANDQFSNPAISWRNKWAPGSTTKERFPLSSTVLVFLTDRWHRDNLIYRGFLIGGSIIVPLQKKPVWWYLKELGTDYLINRAGFIVSYNLIYR